MSAITGSGPHGRIVKADVEAAEPGSAKAAAPEAKAESMRLNLRNMWSRLPLTRADVQTLHGVLRQMVRWKERG